MKAELAYVKKRERVSEWEGAKEERVSEFVSLCPSKYHQEMSVTLGASFRIGEIRWNVVVVHCTRVASRDWIHHFQCV
jgi:hypothetical protein